MSKPVIISVLGTRPEAIKMAPVIQLLAADPELEHQLVITAQHRGMLDDVLALFNIEPAHDLDLMQERQSLEYVTSTALKGLSLIFRQAQPQFVLVHGDTTTTLVGALAAFYLHIPVGHVEAGLRTSTKRFPFPEELNRRVTDLIADHYYCPTARAADNLKQEGGPEGQVFITGNTALDAVRLVYEPHYQFADQQLAEFAAHPGPKILVTAHRRENWGRRLESICHGLLAALADTPDSRMCFSMHPNPVVRETVRAVLLGQPRVLLVDPPRYDVFANLMAACDLILTDSGGIQEEVTQLKRYVLVLRDETERPEALTAGYAQVIGTNDESIRSAIWQTLPACYREELPPPVASPFGDGHAAQRIHQALRWALKIDTARPADYVPGS